MVPCQTRRGFLTLTSAALLGGAVRPGAPRLGGPIFLKADDPAELAAEHRRLHYGAAYCPDAKVEDREHVQAIESAFTRAGVVIAEVGAWKNMLDPDESKRRENRDYVVHRCALAEAVGARCCVDIAGSYDPSVWYGPNSKNLSKDFFDATVENCRHIIDKVKPTRTKFTIEMMGWNLPDGPDSYLQLISAIDRKAFAVHLDVCNVVNSPQRFYNNSELIGECFSKLGRYIISCHAKDLAWIPEMNIHFQEVVPGKGQIDYVRYLRELDRLNSGVPLMMEHLKTAEDYSNAATYIRAMANEAGVQFAG